VRSTEVKRPAPEPVRADALQVVIIGTACWLVAVVVLLIHRPAHDLWLWTACAGSGLGFIGMPLIVLQRRTAERRGSGNTDRE
jgi:cyanate permease